MSEWSGEVPAQELKEVFQPPTFTWGLKCSHQVGLLEQVGLYVPWLRLSCPWALSLLYWPPGTCTGSQPPVSIPGCGKGFLALSLPGSSGFPRGLWLLPWF